MKGLILKDFYISMRVCWYFAIFLILWPLLLLAGAPPTMMVFSALIGSMLPTTLQAYDERDKWMKYADTMPYTRAQIVTVKYIYGFIAVGTATTVAAISMTINTLFIHASNVLTFSEIAFWLSLYLTVAAFSSFMMPFVFWLGAEKGRYVYMVFGLICGFTAVFMSNAGIFSGEAAAPSIPAPLALASILVIVAAVLYAVSWTLSVMLYRKREL